MPTTARKPLPLRRQSAEVNSAEMCRVTGISEGRIRRLRLQGIIPSRLIGERKLVTLRADFEAYLDGKHGSAECIDIDALAEQVAAKVAVLLAKMPLRFTIQ